nr:uncharacterized mitochondrial protein AtMg00810-like [Tanacetum cinerariifolium]
MLSVPKAVLRGLTKTTTFHGRLVSSDVYAAVDSCETVKEIWERVRQIMKGSNIGEQEKKAKLFNEWEKFTSTDGESIESYYHRFMQLMNDLKRNKNFPENIAANLKFLNNRQPEWKRHVAIVRQTKNLREADFTQIYDFLKMNRDEPCLQTQKGIVWVKASAESMYDELSTFLLQNGFSKGTIDPTLFTRRFDDDILVVQVYVDDIIFGSTNPRYATLFSDLIKSRFEMSMMGEMTFFLDLQVNQSPSVIFINQSKYVNEILKKYGLNTYDIIGTSMDIKYKLDLYLIGTPVDATKYRSMIGALMYLTSSRLDIVHATCVCARYQAQPIEKHLKEVKSIFRYLQGTINMGLWYTKDSGFELTRFLDAD